jgi:recombination DNA repair RAD52 pathway protein
MMYGLTNEQYEQLLKPLPAARIAKRKQAGMELSYLEAWDVRAHLIRIFGFGGWSATVESAELAFEDNANGKWNVGYKVVLRLSIHDLGCQYTEAAVGSSTQGSRGEAHDMAVKTAESDALKRAAINLGTQFGLSLYDNGSRNDVVGHSLVKPVSDDSYDDNDEVTGWSPLNDVKSEILRSAIKALQTEDQLRGMWMQLEREGLLDVTLFGGENTAREAILECLADMRGEQDAG